MPHEYLQEFVVIDYTQKMVILAAIEKGKKEEIVGMGQYAVDESTHTADLTLVVSDDNQNKGIGQGIVVLSNLSGQETGPPGLHCRGARR